jgi:hypothetical protein
MKFKVGHYYKINWPISNLNEAFIGIYKYEGKSSDYHSLDLFKEGKQDEDGNLEFKQVRYFSEDQLSCLKILEVERHVKLIERWIEVSKVPHYRVVVKNNKDNSYSVSKLTYQSMETAQNGLNFIYGKEAVTAISLIEDSKCYE